MPDANGNFKGAFVSAEAWERVFGKPSDCEHVQQTNPRYQDCCVKCGRPVFRRQRAAR